MIKMFRLLKEYISRDTVALNACLIASLACLVVFYCYAQQSQISSETEYGSFQTRFFASSLIRETGSQDRIQMFSQKRILLVQGRTKNLYWFLDF